MGLTFSPLLSQIVSHIDGNQLEELLQKFQQRRFAVTNRNHLRGCRMLLMAGGKEHINPLQTHSRKEIEGKKE